jgi:hypothetical protein
MAKRCHLCEKELETTFLDKVVGTMIKVGKKETSKIVFICNSCQKEHKDKLKEKLT